MSYYNINIKRLLQQFPISCLARNQKRQIFF